MSFLQVIILALLPAAGNFAGGMLAEIITPSRKTLSYALHMAAGIVIGVVAVELLPEALGGAPAWAVALALLAGGLFYVLLEWGLNAAKGSGESSASSWMIYAAVAVDLFSDGLMIGVGSVISFEFALILAIGQVTADIPEGFAAIANFRDKNIPRRKRILLSASFVVPALIGASAGFLLLRGQAEIWQLSALAFVAGTLLVAAVEEMISEAHEATCDTSLAAMFLIGGVALFALVAEYFGA